MACVNVSLPYELIRLNLFLGDTFDTTYYSWPVPLDPSEFDGVVSARFEASMYQDVNDTFNVGTLQLVDENGTVHASLTFEPVYGNNANTLLVTKAIEWTWPGAAHTYYVKVVGDPNFIFLNAGGARIWLDLENATKMVIQRPMVGGDQGSSAGLNTNAAINNSNSFNAYATTGGGYKHDSAVATIQSSMLYKRDDALMATVTEYRLVVAAWPQGGDGTTSGTGNVALFDTATGLKITGSEVTITTSGHGSLGGGQFGVAQAVVNTVSFTGSATNFTDGHTYEFLLQNNFSNANLAVGLADLYFVINPAVHVEAYATVLNAGSQNNYSNPIVANTTRYGPDLTTSFEVTTVAKVHYKLRDMGQGGNTLLYGFDRGRVTGTYYGFDAGQTVLDSGNGSWLFNANIFTPLQYYSQYLPLAGLLVGGVTWTVGQSGTAKGLLHGFVFDGIVTGVVSQVHFLFSPAWFWADTISLPAQNLKVGMAAYIGGVSLVAHTASISPVIYSASPLSAAVPVVDFSATADKTWSANDFTNANFNMILQATADAGVAVSAYQTMLFGGNLIKTGVQVLVDVSVAGSILYSNATSLASVSLIRVSVDFTPGNWYRVFPETLPGLTEGGGELARGFFVFGVSAGDCSTGGISIVGECPTTDPEANIPYSAALSVISGTPPYHWELIAGTLPDFMGIDAATGAIVGTPTSVASSYSYTIRVTDFVGGTAYLVCGFGQGAETPVIKSIEILKGSNLEADWYRGDLLGANAGVPIPNIFTQELTGALKLAVLPPPNAAKLLDYVYTPYPTELSAPGTSIDGGTVELPDDFTPFIKYGVLGDMFGKTGEAHDPQREQVCNQLFELGIELARMQNNATNQ